MQIYSFYQMALMGLCLLRKYFHSDELVGHITLKAIRFLVNGEKRKSYKGAGDGIPKSSGKNWSANSTLSDLIFILDRLREALKPEVQTNSLATDSSYNPMQVFTPKIKLISSC